MRTWIVVTVLVILAAAGGGGYYALDVYPQQRFRTGLDQALATLPAGTTATYASANYSVMSHRAVVTNLKMHGQIQSDPPQPFDVTVDSIEADNPNLEFPAAWSSAVAGPTSLTPESALPFADTVILHGVTFHSAIINATEDSVRITKARLYPWALLHDGMPTWKELQASILSNAATKRLDDLRPLLRLEAAVMLGIGYDGYELGAAKVSEAVPGLSIAYDIRKMTGGGFDRATMRDASGEGITFSSAPIGTVTIDRVAIGAVDMRESMIRIVNGEPLTPALLDKMSIGRVDYRGITVQQPDHPAMHIGGFSIGPVAFARGMPVSGQLGLTDITIAQEQTADPRVQEVFDELKLKSMTVSFALAYDWDLAQKRISVHDTMLKVNELGTMTLSADVANLAPDVSRVSQAQLAHAKLRFDDASLVDRLVGAGAAKNGADPAAFRQQVAAMVRQFTADGGPELMAAGNAVGDFVATPHSLVIELSPKSPVPVTALFGAMANPGSVAAQLGLVVSTNK